MNNLLLYDDYYYVYVYMYVYIYCYCCTTDVCLSFFHFLFFIIFHCSFASMVDIINLRADYLFDDCRLVFISIKFNFSLFICLLVLNKNLLKKTDTHTHTELNNGRTQPTYNISWSFYFIFSLLFFSFVFFFLFVLWKCVYACMCVYDSVFMPQQIAIIVFLSKKANWYNWLGVNNILITPRLERNTAHCIGFTLKMCDLICLKTRSDHFRVHLSKVPKYPKLNHWLGFLPKSTKFNNLNAFASRFDWDF